MREALRLQQLQQEQELEKQRRTAKAAERRADDQARRDGRREQAGAEADAFRAKDLPRTAPLLANAARAEAKGDFITAARWYRRAREVGDSVVTSHAEAALRRIAAK
ncbi:MAG: hypothetical protein NTY19_50640 [Planctomycetota bacterium]|nr:hypothetical protein [Planctomycetota bacterium]